MSADINALLALPQKERRKIAEQLWHSLAPINTIAKEDKEILELLEKRWQDIELGKSNMYSSKQLKEMVAAYRNKK